MTLCASETRRSFTKRLITVLLVFLVFSITVLQSGIRRYKQEIRQSLEFGELQEKRIFQVKDIDNLTIRGLNTLSNSSPIIAIFSSSVPFKLLQSYINAAEIMKIDSPHYGKSVFENDSYKNIDLSWLILILGSLLALGWNFSSFRNTEYIKFLLSFARPIQVFLGIILARVFILTLYLAFLTAVIIGQFLLNGIGLNGADILAILTFGLISLLVSVLFLIAGALIGIIKNTSRAIVTAFVCWLCLIFLFPIVSNEIFSSQAISQTKSLYRHEIQKLEIILKHYYTAGKEISNLKSISEKMDAVKKWNELYWSSTFRQIETLETEMMSGIKDQAERLYLMNVFTPVSFYSSVNNELSSRGYNFLIDFYKYVQGKQKGFVRYYFDHIFDDYSKIEPFMKKEDYVFQSRPSLPKYFGLGLLINTLYIVLALFLSFFFFKKSVWVKPERPRVYGKVNLSFKKGKSYLFKQTAPDLADRIYSVLKGHPESYSGGVSIDGQKLVKGKELDFIYLPDPEKLCGDMKVGNYVRLIGGLTGTGHLELDKLMKENEAIADKKFAELPRLDKMLLLAKLVSLKKSKTLLMVDFMIMLEEDADISNIWTLLEEPGRMMIQIIPFHQSSFHSKYDQYANVFMFEDKYKLIIVKKID